MSIETQLFIGQRVQLGAIDHEKDPAVESRWTHDVTFQRAIGQGPARPLSPAQVKKRYDKIEKQLEDSNTNFYFTIRTREDNRLLGFAQLYWIEWSHGTGSLRMAIGDPNDRGKGYGGEALEMVLRYVFDELNFHRLGALTGADNPGAVRFFQRHGFVEEVRRRQALHRDGKTWDLLHLGILAEEFFARQENAGTV